MERLEIFDKEDDKNPKIITLENCVKISQEPAPANQITVVMKTGTLTLNAPNETELKNWVEALQHVAFKDKSHTLTRNSVMEEENDLYCSSFGDGIFAVYLHESDAKQLTYSLEAKQYKMHLTTTEIQLKDPDVNGSNVVARWPYRFIRKYGYSEGKIKFEAGRKCDTGEGEFRFHHQDPKIVFRCLADKMKSMKKLINGESTVSTLDCGENQFNAVLSMEPGSRSPLPHSDHDQSQSSHLLRGFLSSNDSLNNVSSSSSSTVSNVTAAMKITPCKPPRKSLPTDTNDKPLILAKPQRPTKFLDYEPVILVGSSELTTKSLGVKASPPPPIPTSPHIKSPIQSPANDQPPQIPARHESMIQDDRDYEQIETISQAWKTRGVNDVKHTENLSPDEDITDFKWQRSQSQKETGTNRKIPLAVNPYCDMQINRKSDNEHYDKLDFFAPANPSGDYRTIVSVNTTHPYKKQTSQPITSHDYEIVGEHSSNEQKSYRLADDSYMGYGILRQPGVNNNTAMKSKQSPPPPPPQKNLIFLAEATLTNTLETSSINASDKPAEDLLNHRKFNGLEYAMVSKPKQV